MRVVKIVFIALALLLVAAIVLQTAASESGEVVVLSFTDTAGEVHDTRLWVVDHQGQAWIRSGQANSGWASRLAGSADVVIERDGTLESYRVVAVPEMASLINDLMLEKYGWREQVISAMLGSREASLPLRLEPMGTSSDFSH